MTGADTAHDPTGRDPAWHELGDLTWSECDDRRWSDLAALEASADTAGDDNQTANPRP